MTEQQGILELRVANLEESVGEIRKAVRSIDGSLQTLTRLEVHHSETRDSLTRTFTQLGDHEERIRALEIEAPSAKMIRNWIVSGVIGIVVLAGLTLFRLIGLNT